MLSQNQQPVSSVLTSARIINGLLFASLIIYLAICHALTNELGTPLDEEQRSVLKTVLYTIAIILFPTTNLIRHIQLRLNQTMPLGSIDYGAEAKRRYLATVIVSLALIESIGIFGLAMFLLGDGFNTLYIFIGLASLGLFLYRPKEDEYLEILTALAKKSHL